LRAPSRDLPLKLAPLRFEARPRRAVDERFQTGDHLTAQHLRAQRQGRREQAPSNRSDQQRLLRRARQDSAEAQRARAQRALCSWRRLEIESLPLLGAEHDSSLIVDALDRVVTAQ